MVYTGGSFSQLAEDTLFRACMTPGAEASLVKGIFAAPLRFLHTFNDPVLQRFFVPIFTALAGSARTCRLLQSGRMNVYLFYIFSTTILLLGWALFQHN